MVAAAVSVVVDTQHELAQLTHQTNKTKILKVHKRVTRTQEKITNLAIYLLVDTP